MVTAAFVLQHPIYLALQDAKNKRMETNFITIPSATPTQLAYACPGKALLTKESFAQLEKRGHLMRSDNLANRFGGNFFPSIVMDKAKSYVKQHVANWESGARLSMDRHAKQDPLTWKASQYLWDMLLAMKNPYSERFEEAEHVVAEYTARYADDGLIRKFFENTENRLIVVEGRTLCPLYEMGVIHDRQKHAGGMQFQSGVYVSTGGLPLQKATMLAGDLTRASNYFSQVVAHEFGHTAPQLFQARRNEDDTALIRELGTYVAPDRKHLIHTFREALQDIHKCGTDEARLLAVQSTACKLLVARGMSADTCTKGVASKILNADIKYIANVVAPFMDIRGCQDLAFLLDHKEIKRIADTYAGLLTKQREIPARIQELCVTFTPAYIRMLMPNLQSKLKQIVSDLQDIPPEAASPLQKTHAAAIFSKKPHSEQKR